MARNDIKAVSGDYGTYSFQVAGRTQSGQNQILSGEPVKGRVGNSSNYTQVVETGEPRNGTDIFLGIAQGDSTETAAASGVVSGLVPASLIAIAARPAASLIDAMSLNRVFLRSVFSDSEN